MGFEEYDRYDALGLAELVQRGEVSPKELLEEALIRTERVNEQLNAVVTDMSDEARRRIERDPIEGPFAGVPFLLKDLACGYAGFPLTNGSRLYRDHVPAFHSELVKRYLEAGLVVFGKTNTPEFGLSGVTEPELHGVARNPWNLERTPGGSSGGSAAAVAAGIVPMAHGGDGGGSLRIPASCCGLFGLKPSRSRLPVGPKVPERFFNFTVEHAVTRTVRDSAALLDATAGDEPTALFAAKPEAGFHAVLDEPFERPLRIAFTDEPLLPAPRNEEATRAVKATAKLCESLGHDVEPAHPRFDARAFAGAFFRHFAASAAAELQWAERQLHRRVHRNDVEPLTWVLGMIGRSMSAGEFVLQRRILHIEAVRLVSFFQDYDVLLTPTMGKPPIELGAFLPRGISGGVREFVRLAGIRQVFQIPGLLDRITEGTFDFTPYASPFNVTGQPSATVPLHWTDEGLPMGSMITARLGEEKTLLRLARQLEVAQPWFARRPPTHA